MERAEHDRHDDVRVACAILLPSPSAGEIADRSIRGPGVAARSRLAELTDALAQVHRLYCDNAAKPQLLDALDNLIACACVHFAEEELRGKSASPASLRAHSDNPDNILHYMLLLREYVDRFDKFGLLSDLHFLDRWLENISIGRTLLIPYKSRQRRLAPLLSV
jgi:hypothetical protein